MILEDNENVVMVPLCWLTQNERQKLLQNGYQVIPIPGYQETAGLRTFKIIGPYNDDRWLFKLCSIPIWEDWKLTAKYATNAERPMSTTGQQMFDHLEDDEKIKAFTYSWYDKDYIVKYFREHPDLLKRAKNISKNMCDIHGDFEKLF